MWGSPLGVLFGKVQLANHLSLEDLRLSFKNVCKLWLLLQMCVEEADNNLQEIFRAETLV